MAKEIKENAALNSMLQSSADKPAEPAVDQPAEPAKATPKVLRAVHARDTDEVTETTEVGQVIKTVKRKYRRYRVVPVGEAATRVFGGDGVVVEGCLDESEAKQVAYQAAGVGGSASKYQTKVVAA